MTVPFMVYGASGYTGRLLVEAALSGGLRPILAGRNETTLAPLAERLGLEYRVVRLGDPPTLDAALRKVRVVLHAAGPFSATARQMVDACLRTGTHYLDITGEVRVIEQLATRHAEARRRGIMIMPAVGFDVVATDCLAAHVAHRLPGAHRLALGIRGFGSSSRGSGKALVEAVNYGVVRRDGVIARVPLGALSHRFDYGDGPRESLNLSWGDVAASYYTTGIPNIAVYAEATPLARAILGTCRALGWMFGTAPWQVWLRASMETFAKGPDEAERSARRVAVVAEAEDRRGHRAISRLGTPEAYTFTGTSGAAVAARVLAGDFESGFHTPARIYGRDFVLALPAVVREDIA